MALQKFTDDMHIIAKLDDEPNDVGGLTADELKAKFDEGGVTLQRYINETMLPQLETMGVEQAVLLPENAGGFKYMRLNSDKVLEVSTDGKTWQATGSSGHLIFDKYGKQMPQRSRIKFADSEVTDDGTYTIVQGEAVKFSEAQSLTDAQKQQARDNIGAPAPYEAGDNIAITGRIITTKAFPCNPNLMDNWYFGKPVNQRGGHISLQGVPVYNDAACTSLIGNQIETAVTCIKSGTNYQRIINGQGGGYVKAADVVRGYTGTGYTIDRWKIDDSDGLGSLTINSDKTITISNGAAQNPLWFTQILENVIPGTRTASALVTSITGLANMYSGASTSAGLLLGLNAMQSSEEDNIGMRIVVFPNSKVTLKAVGFELGSQQTLAHKEYGEWVFNEIPKFGNQLAECQRYFVRIGSDSAYRIVGTGTAYGSSTCGILVPLPVEMRTIPAVSIVGQLVLRNKGGSEVVCSGVTLYVMGDATAYLNCTASGLTLGASYDAYLNPGSYLSFSADL